MNEIQKEKEKLILFTKVGAVVLTSLLLLVSSLYFYPEATSTVSHTVRDSLNSKELPIYCVEQEKPLISISFDAAWGNTIDGL